MTDLITAGQFHASRGVEEWRVVGDGACTFFRTSSFGEATRLVTTIGQLAGIEEHRPDIDVRHDGVTVRLITITDDHYGMSERDVELARQISAAARDLGLAGDPSAVQSLLVIPGAPLVADVACALQLLREPPTRTVIGDCPSGDPLGRRSRRARDRWFIVVCG